MKNLSRTLLAVGIFSVITGTIYAQGLDTKAPDFTLTDLSGQQFTLSDQEGKVVMIFFFGHGCPHCHSNAPNTQDLYNQFKANTNFVAIGIDTWDGSNSDVSTFKSTTGVGYRLLLKGGQVEEDYSTSYDRLFVIDNEGIVKYISPGYATKEAAAEAKTIIQGLLAQTVDVNETEEGKTNLVFPNPVREVATISNPFESKGRVQVEIVSVTGQVLRSENHDFSSLETSQLDFSEIPTGFYFLRITNGRQEVFAQPLVKEE